MTASERKNAVMNLAEPSGSSPPEKPPGIMMIWLFLMPSTSAFVLSATAAGVRLLMMSVVASAPARSKAAAVSYSQFVPGKTGIITRGFAMVPLNTSGVWVSLVTASTVPSWLR